MPFYEREEKILNILKSGKEIPLAEISQKLYISLPTLRRDLIKLEKKGTVVRLHGKAALSNNPADTRIPFDLRNEEQNSAKNIIAHKAASMVNDGDTIMLDASTSAYFMVPYLSEKKNIIVITSGAKTAVLLAQCGIHTICTGGHMINKSLSYIGNSAMSTIELYNADIAFFSCRGVSDDGKVSDNSTEENDIRRAMIKHSARNVLLCDLKKFGKICFNNLCNTDELDAVITEED